MFEESPATTSRTTEAIADYLVTSFPVPGEMPISFLPDRAETLRGTFRVETLGDGKTIVTRAAGSGLTFVAQRFERAGHVPVTAFLPIDGSATGYLINDLPKAGISVDDLNDDDRAYVRGERA
jgi:hypothetical protein